MKMSRFLSISSTILAVCTFVVFAGEKASKDSNAQCLRQVSKAGCPNGAAKKACPNYDSTKCEKHSDAKAAATPDKQIMFFMNPNGRPCQMQLSILDGMKEKLGGLATVKYIKTTESSDQETFYKYGIRGLPSLIILDKNNKEIKRFTPGIQDENVILSALKGSDK